jgi:hypothetical protein
MHNIILKKHIRTAYDIKKQFLYEMYEPEQPSGYCEDIVSL